VTCTNVDVTQNVEESRKVHTEIKIYSYGRPRAYDIVNLGEGKAG
jgi:hypothetical protein